MGELAKLFIFMFFCTGIAWAYEHTYVPTLNGRQRSKLIYFFLMALLICYGGFRGQYNDTWTYRDTYVYVTYPFPEAWDYIPKAIGENPAFVFVNSILKTYDVEVHLFLFFYFFWTTVFFMMFIKRYATGFGLTVYFFFTMSCYQFNMAAMKQVMATGICLVAFPLALKRGWKPKLLFSLFVLVAAGFHVYALMYLCVFLLDFRPWTIRTYILLAGIITGGFLLQPLLGTIIDLTTAIGENYTVEALSGAGISFLRLVIVWIPVVLSFLYRKDLFSDCNSSEQVIMHLTMIFAGIQFVGIFGTALYFGRLSYYFAIMPVITLPWMLQKITKYHPRDGRFITVCAILGYLGFFYFSNTLETHYDTAYAAISLRQFLDYLFTWIEGLFA